MRTRRRVHGGLDPGPSIRYSGAWSKRASSRRSGSAEDGATVKYSVTKKGKQELEEMQRTLASAGKRERVMIRLFADLLPPEVWASAFVNRGREIFDVFQEKISQIPQPQREAMLREARLMFDANISWVDSQLQSKKKRVHRRIVEVVQWPTWLACILDTIVFPKLCQLVFSGVAEELDLVLDEPQRHELLHVQAASSTGSCSRGACRVGRWKGRQDSSLGRARMVTSSSSRKILSQGLILLLRLRRPDPDTLHRERRADGLDKGSE